MTIAQQLVDVSNAKKAIKAAIELKGVTVGTSAFSTYAAKIGDITSGGSSTPTPKPYVRPSDWLALPTLTETDQKFVGLHMVAEDSNFLALTAAGNYTVDWGDGTVQNFAANVVAEHTYDFANVNLGAVTANGWKQAIVTLTPQAGQNLTALNLHKKHSQLGLPTYSSGFVDIAIAGSLLTSLLLGSSSNAAATQTITFRDLEQVKVVKSAITNWGYVFYGCSSLVSVVALDTTACTNTSSMFQNCSSLQTVPLFNLAACTNTTSMFQSCYSLQTVPLFNLAACTNATSMFSSCTSLQTVPLLNLAACTSATSMFYGCSSLQTVPLFNLAACTNTSNMFYNCSSLQTVPLFNLAACTNAAQMFYGCTSLQTVPLFNLAACTSATSMFQNCSSLIKADLIGLKTSSDFTNTKLSKSAMERVLSAVKTGTATLTITTSYAASANPAVSKTACGTTIGSTTITQANTSSLTVGMTVTGTGSPLTTATACTFTDAGDLVTKTAHGLSNGDLVSFASIVTTTGMVINTTYYVINATADTFQVSLTLGGAAINLVTNGTGTMKYDCKVVSIVANTSVTVSKPMTATGSQTLSFRNLNTAPALLRGWTITG